ncbi:major facilitator superfamily transporter [Colletotrichum tofieldiae]|nr:major facilitator superfamily transporter [Colletotrichum tofieldiae]GKT70756.1 major facilitator superfamily transporter [Colletotrichum tofieldiae]GKT94346.1 major facilitator superfamily transporter [Colletotrichum tofieldiae]
MLAVETFINVDQPKSKDLEIAEKQPSLPESAGEDLKAGQVELLDVAEISLQQNGISHAYMRELLEDEKAQKKLVRKYIDKQALSYGTVFDLSKDASWTTAYGIPYGAWVTFFIFNGPFCVSKFRIFHTISRSFVGALIIALQMPATNVADYTKRVYSTAFAFLAYCVGDIFGPQAFLASEAPAYETGCRVIMCCIAG